MWRSDHYIWENGWEKPMSIIYPFVKDILEIRQRGLRRCGGMRWSCRENSKEKR